MNAWHDCWPPALSGDTLVRARVAIQLHPGVLSYAMTVEDTAEAFTEFMRSPECADRFGHWLHAPDEVAWSSVVLGGSWSGTGDNNDFTVENP